MSAIACGVIVAILAPSATGSTSTPIVISTLSGAGSPLDAPFVGAMANGFDVLFGIQVSYDASGPDAGVGQLASGVAAFATSEAPLSHSQLAACGNCVQLPWAQAGVAVGYNVPGAGTRLRLSGPLLAQIYLGRITNWNDAAIKALNPKLTLPNLTIEPIHATATGETYVFTDYLSKVSSTWRKQIGAGNDVSFPASGLTGAGDVGATALLSATKGAIGYVSPAFLITHGLPAAAVQNAAGNYEYPNLGNIAAASSAVTKVPASGAVDIVDPPKTLRDAYPLSTLSYAVVSGNAGAEQKAALREWLLYAIGLGKSYGPALDFPTLPAALVTADQHAIARFAPTF